MGEEDVEKGKERVAAVERRAFGAAVELEGGVVDGDEVVEDGEVSGGGLALDPAQGIEVRGAHGGADAGGEEIGGAGEGVGAFRGFRAVVAGGALEDGAGVVELCGDHVLRDGQGGGFVVAAAVLLAAEQDVSGNAAVGAGNEFPMRSEESDGDAMLMAARHQACGNGGVPAEGDDAFQIVQRDAKFCFPFVADLHGGSVFAEVSAIEGDIESVEVLLHETLNFKL